MPLRSSALPRGLPNLTSEQQRQVTVANRCIDHSGLILDCASALGICGGEENPQSSILWWFRSRQRLLARFPACIVDFCAGGSSFRKRTKLLFLHCGTPCSDHLRCHGTQGRCEFSNKLHSHAHGSHHGVWRSKLAEPYPPRIAAFIGQTLTHAAHSSAVAYLTRITK